MPHETSSPEASRRPTITVCPDCDPRTRRTFLKTVGGAALTAAVGSAIPAGLARAALRPADAKPAETYVKALYDSLKPEQRKLMCFPFGHELRSEISNNWNIVDEKTGSVGTLYGSDQQELIRQIFKGVVSEDGYERFQKQMKDDAGGFEKYTCAIFGEPGTGKFEWVMTGRHLTIRADGDSVDGTAFGGPIFYGHAVQFEEKPDHPGNVWWHQARLANDLYKALDGKQQARALVEKAPPDDKSTIELLGPDSKIAGLPVSELSKDLKAHLEKTLRSMLSMYRASDVDEAMACLKENGGFDALKVSFYKEGDIGEDGIWDRWRVEGPTCVWYFRGSPHVHAWVNIAHKPPKRAAV